MEALETYTSTLAVLSAALLLVAAGLGKKEKFVASVNEILDGIATKRRSLRAVA